METEDLLVSLGEVAAAFAGFSGVVGALGAQSVSELPAFTRFRFANMLVTSVAAALFAFLPVVLSRFPAIGSAAWGWSSLTLGAFAGVFFFLRLRAGRRTVDREEIRPRFAYVWMLTLLLVLLTQIAGLASRSEAICAASYALGVFGLLVLSGMQFVTLVLPRRRSQ